MDQNLYDEFGNYIGPEIEDTYQEEDVDEPNIENGSPMADGVDEDDIEIEAVDEDHESSNALLRVASINKPSEIVLHEDKDYYASAEDVYGKDIETLVEDEDAQTLQEPIIKRITVKKFDIQEDDIPELNYSRDYQNSAMECPELIRNISIVGHLHHGKTSLVDMLVSATHSAYSHLDPNYELRYTDTRFDERHRGITLKAKPMSLLLQDMSEKSFLINMMDTPGHVNFSDEVTASYRLSDGVVLVVDALEGVLIQTERLVQHAIQERLPIVLIINKVDRLILELKLPPNDAYYKLRHTINEINNIMNSYYGSTLGTQETDASAYKPRKLSPEVGNVVFASTLFGWSFSLQSFAKIYTDYQRHLGSKIDYRDFARRLWGDLYHDPEQGTFSKTPTHESSSRSFVEFILEPLYKIYSHTVGQDVDELQVTLKKIGIKLSKQELSLDIKPLMKTILQRFFGRQPRGLVDMISKFIPSPINGGNANKVETTYTGPQDSNIALHMKSCRPDGQLMIMITKLYHSVDLTQFEALGRVMSGTVKNTDKVKVLGEGYTMDDEEDMCIRQISELNQYNSRYRVPLQSVPAGNWVLISGIDSNIIKTATITSHHNQSTNNHDDDLYIFKPLKFNTMSCVKIAVEPLNPSELPKMLEGLRRIHKSYPLLTTRVEESGEHIIMGTGELYMDSALHDLRKLYGDLEIKVADPVVCFSETVTESSIKCFAQTPNKHNKLTMICEPLERGLAQDLENNFCNLDWDLKRKFKFFAKYEWDMLASQSVWAFGPEPTHGPNVLLDETFTKDSDGINRLNQIKDSIIQGFRWGVREGPLCDEPIRNVKFKLLNVDASDLPIHRGSGQIIPTARRVAYSSFLTATPRIMEPVYHVEIQTPLDCVKVIYAVLERRRGHVTEDLPKPGSPLYVIKAFVPVIDSFGLETDIRSSTQGNAFCMSVFHHWSVVPGDPLDKSIVLRPLEPAPPQYLAREFMVKTRRRKGLSEDVSIGKYFDDPLLLTVASQSLAMDDMEESFRAYL
ncbi:U5 small nuclear ribonucleoprotein [Acrasis kona]|uniref:U5 small nuclear ribonucleoprotein n=1 Tax=Acrasis kona TaxID=1008807 RepID=A0AAW2Z9Z0_9EUKA